MEASELNQYRYIIGGLAAPGKGRAFIVILGRKREGLESMVVIDEMECQDLYELIHTAAQWDAFFHCDRWVGDSKNVTMRQFVMRIRKEVPGSQEFNVHPTLLAEKKQGFYEYAMPTLREMIDEGLLVLPPSGLLRDYLSKIDADDLTSLELGSVPAVEALTFAAVELSRYKAGGKKHTKVVNDYQRL